jgi:hypothetical protein
MFAIEPPTAPAGLDPPVVVAAADVRRPQLEVSTTTLPRFDNVDGATRTSRVDITLLPQHRSGIGLAFGVSNLSGTQPPLSPWTTSTSSVDFGVHWRLMLDSNYRFDVTAYRRAPNADAISLIEGHDPSYGARVELGLGSIQGRSRGFVADRGFLGFQLESGARVTIKRSRGAPMIYYRNTF